jgi:hypothetical protein
MGEEDLAWGGDNENRGRGAHRAPMLQASPLQGRLESMASTSGASCSMRNAGQAPNDLAVPESSRKQTLLFHIMFENHQDYTDVVEILCTQV